MINEDRKYEEIIEELEQLRREVAENEALEARVMAQTAVLRQEIADRKKVEEVLQERASLGQLGADVGKALSTGETLGQMLQGCCDAFVENLGVAFARIWTFNARENVLELQASGGMYTHVEGPHKLVPVGKYKIGLIAQERKPHLTNNVLGDPRVHNQEWAKAEGMVAFAGHPLLVENRLVGVMAIFSKRPLSDIVLTALASVADVIAIGIERKRGEDERLRSQKLESLGVLAGGIAHDFNNLLTPILGNVSILMHRMGRTGREYESLAEIERATAQARGLTRQLLTFAKGGRPVKVVADIAVMLKESCRLATSGSNVGVDVVTHDDLLPVEADTVQLGQVFHNLVLNAVQAMPQGGVITAAAGNAVIAEHELPPLRGGRYVIVTIEDKGIGIPHAYLNQIFDPFFSTKERGSGLGLATAYSIIRAHQGHVTVESEPGRGTTFSVYLPASGKESEKTVSLQEQIATGEGRVLVMDDEPFIRDMADRLLTALGYEVTCAADGREAIDIYLQSKDANKPFAVVIMDLTVSRGMGGKEAVMLLKEVDPSAKVIVSSGYSDDDIISDLRKSGFSGCLCKPYGFAELANELKRVIEEQRQG